MCNYIWTFLSHAEQFNHFNIEIILFVIFSIRKSYNVLNDFCNRSIYPPASPPLLCKTPVLNPGIDLIYRIYIQYLLESLLVTIVKLN